MFNGASVAVRWLLSMFVVFATYNVTGYSYYHWVSDGSGDWSLKTLAGWLLVIMYGTYAIHIWRGMGPLGVAITLLLLFSATWLVQDAGFLNLNDPNTVTTVTEVLFASLISVGFWWSHVKTRFTGSPDANNVNQH
ncbi:MAG: hypothetical protein GC191_17850 [Azospirillum sp.]|nr:hypothetical protein [Azospirillum sp.]